MCHLGSVIAGEHGGAGLRVGLDDLRGFFQWLMILFSWDSSKKSYEKSCDAIDKHCKND